MKEKIKKIIFNRRGMFNNLLRNILWTAALIILLIAVGYLIVRGLNA